MRYRPELRDFVHTDLCCTITVGAARRGCAFEDVDALRPAAEIDARRPARRTNRLDLQTCDLRFVAVEAGDAATCATQRFRDRWQTERRARGDQAVLNVAQRRHFAWREALACTAVVDDAALRGIGAFRDRHWWRTSRAAGSSRAAASGISAANISAVADACAAAASAVAASAGIARAVVARATATVDIATAARSRDQQTCCQHKEPTAHARRRSRGLARRWYHAR